MNNTKLNISLWEHDSTSNEFRHFLNFSVWIDKLAPVETPINRSLFSLATKGQPLEENHQKANCLVWVISERSLRLILRMGPSSENIDAIGK